MRGLDMYRASIVNGWISKHSPKMVLSLAFQQVASAPDGQNLEHIYFWKGYELEFFFMDISRF